MREITRGRRGANELAPRKRVDEDELLVPRATVMDVGHPVVTVSGACGIITTKRSDGTATVDLIGGGTVKVAFASLRDYFTTPFLVDLTPPEIPKRTYSEILQEKFLLFLRACREPVPATALASIAVAEGASKELAHTVVYKLLDAKQIHRSGVKGQYRYVHNKEAEHGTVISE